MPAAELLRKLSPEFGGEEEPAFSVVSIAQQELRIGHPLPDELREFYLSVGGFYFPEWMWCFFSLRDVLAYSDYRHRQDTLITTRTGDVLNSRYLFIIADVLIDCPSYWIYLDENSPNYGAVFSDGDEPAWQAASSFDAFVELFAADHGELYIGFDESNGEQGVAPNLQTRCCFDVTS